MKVTLTFAFDNQVGDLNKEATAAKRVGDWKTAIRLLREAKALEGERYADTRLAKFLQASGDFEGAMEEIDQLIKNSLAWSNTLFGHQPRSIRRKQQAGWISRIHKDAALICKREKDARRQAHHEREYERWLATRRKLEETARAEKSAERQEWEEARKGGRAAATAFLEKKSRR